MVESYLSQAVAEGQATHEPLAVLEDALGKLIDLAKPFATEKRDPDPLKETWEELTSAQTTLAADIEAFGAEVAARASNWNEGENNGRGTTPLFMRCIKTCAIWLNAVGT